MEDKYLDAGRITLRKLDSFLDHYAIRCRVCTEGQYVGVPYERAPSRGLLTSHDSIVMISAFSARNRDFLTLRGLATQPVGRDAPQEPTVYTVPIVCSKCGNVQHFSLGDIVAFIKEGGHE